MTFSGFITIDGERKEVTFEIPGLVVREDEPIIILPNAHVTGHKNELLFRQDRNFDDPVGIGFVGNSEGGYGHISGGHLREDNRRVMNSLIQFKKNELDRGTSRRGGEITIHCLDGRLGEDDNAMIPTAEFRAGESKFRKATVDWLVVNRVTLRGQEV